VSADVLIIGGGALFALVYNVLSCQGLKHAGHYLSAAGKPAKVAFIILGGCLILMNFFASILALSLIQKKIGLSENPPDSAYFFNLAAGGLGVFLGLYKSGPTA